MPENIILQNDALRAVISPTGAQLISLRDVKTDEKLLWEGEEGVWRDSAPWLFPIIGQLKDDRFLYEGKPYRTPMHGFTKKSLFTAEKTGDTSAALTLTSSDETLSVYPWRFLLTITYTLEGRHLKAHVTVKNADARTMYYALGAHPGFVCQAGDTLDFGDAKSLTYRRLRGEDHLTLKDDMTLPLEHGRLSLKSDLFKDDAIIVTDPTMTRVTVHKAQGADVALSFDRVEYLGLWTRYLPDGQVKYICLEPWHGVDDLIDADGLIEHKLGIKTLAPEAVDTFDISVEAL